MTAVVSSQLGAHQQPSNRENIADYVNAQLRQSSSQPPRRAGNNTSLHQGFSSQQNGRGRPANDRTVTRTSSRSLAQSSSEVGGVDRQAQKPTETTESQTPLISRPVGQTVRANTDIGPRRPSPLPKHEVAEENWELRHGWEDQYNSSEYLGLLSSAFYMYYTDKRHETGGKPKEEDHNHPPQEWRMRDRLKTVSAALAICLNIGVDPPDVVKTNPTAKLECWIDPTLSTAASSKTMEHIGKKLQEQYETLSIRVRYKVFLDPSVDETRKFCTSLRRNAKDERILFHYNGHGVPLPTQSGEIWVFNKTYTQYIPVSLYDLQAWLGAPSLYVFDCSHAGNIIQNFDRFVEKHETENADLRQQDPNVQLQTYSDNIQLAACGKSESLPTSPDLPADLFTCCLTTPIEISLRFFVLENQLPSDLTLNDIGRVPGRLQERRSPLGELNWIFTAITDTIAWNMLPRSLFKKLFRQDLMVAALFRNFLLSERVMRAYGCRPMSMPQLPETHDHPLWQAWDLAVEMVLSQLPAMLASEDGGPPYEYQHSNFFTEQLTAFDVYLAQGAPSQKAPSQLPIVLQVLLSQVHRLRALILLSKFLDLGPWAVNLALTIGIFPYVLKLLQSAAYELKPVMIFIWARILAVDGACQADLLKDNGYQYFLTMLNPQSTFPVGNASEHRAMSAFIVAMFCKDFRQGQVVCLSPELIDICIGHLHDAENPLLRQWSCLCISMLWADFAEAKWVGIRCLAHQKLCELALDPVPEVRAAALHALTNFLGIPHLTEQVAQTEESIASTVLIMTADGNSMVRKELLIFFSRFVKRYINKFLVAAYEQLLEERDLLLHPSSEADSGRPYVPQPPRNTSETGLVQRVSQNSVQGSIWMHLLVMTIDAHPGVARDASIIVDDVHEALLESPLGSRAQSIIDDIIRLSRRPAAMSRQPSTAPAPRLAQATPSSTPQVPLKQEGYLSIGIRRTASVAAALKHLALGNTASTDNLPNSVQKTVTNTSTVQPVSSGPLRSRVPAEWSSPPDEHDHAPTSTAYQHAKVPTPRGFKGRDVLQAPKLPLKSGFFDWSIEYFREPQMKPNEPDEPGSDDYNSRLWRRVRNEKTLTMTQPLKGIAGTSQWNIPKGFFNNGSQPMKMCFHQFEEHLAVADDRDSICIWNWQQSARLNRFSNGNPPGSKINEARFINEDDQALLMTGSSDGVIKIFRNYESEKQIEMVSAFRALTDLVPSTKNAGLVFDWQQGQGKLLVAGDVKVIRVWNAATEICTTDIPARSGSCITSLTSDQVAGNVFIGGYGDGAIRVFDQRLKPASAMVKVWREHKQWITNIHMQRGGLRELVSGSRNGEIKLWDIRKDAPINTITATKQTLRTLSVHEHAPVFATGTERHNVNVFNVNVLLPMAQKRKNAPSPSDEHLYFKRSRPSIVGGDDRPCSPSVPQPRVDPTYGQRGAFPGLEEYTNDSTLFYGPASDGLEYLRMVRAEAKEVPNLLVAPTSSRVTTDPCADYSQGFYADGAYTAVPDFTSRSAPRVDTEQDIDPQDAYYTSLCDRFMSLSIIFRSQPPDATVYSKSPFNPSSSARWRRYLLNTQPTMLLLAQLRQEDVILGLVVLETLITAQKLQKHKSLGAWAWGLLARCRAVGEMGSEEVGVLRDLGKKARGALRGIRAGLEENARSSEGFWEEDDGEHGKSAAQENLVSNGLDGSYGETDSAPPSSRPEDSTPLEPDEVNHSTGSAPPSAPGPQVLDPLAAARRQLLDSLESPFSPTSTTISVVFPNDNANPQFPAVHLESSPAKRGNGAQQEQQGHEVDDDDEEKKLQVCCATLDMIITVVGEFYGQRDLLDGRLLWDELQ